MDAMTYEGKSATEATATEDTTPTEPILRRTLLKAGATALGVAVLGASMQKVVVPTAGAVETATAVRIDKFMAASRCLIQHGLSSDVGARMVGILYAKIPTLDADLDAIISTAREKNSKVVEDFFDALPDGHVKDSAHQIIFGWYAGVVDESPTAEVFAYEEALMYQPTKDAVALPTYSFNGPNHWTDVDPPLSAMPEF
jgi:fructose 5-dehydrogenase small subunit